MQALRREAGEQRGRAEAKRMKDRLLRLAPRFLAGAGDEVEGAAREEAILEAPARARRQPARGVVEAGQTVSFNGPPAVVRADPLALRRVVDNLVGNALRYAGNARVSVELAAGVTRLIVEDDGPGIPEAELERVRQPFRRVEDSRNRATGGTGLGLYIAQQLVQRQGAALVLSNRPEGGLRAEVVF